MKGENKQLHRRTKRRIMARYGVAAPERTCFTMNLSKTGAFLKTNNVVRPGTTIQLELEFPEQTMSLWAHVVWAKKVPAQLAHVLDCGMGVRFINPGAEWEEFFEKWQASKGGA